MNYWQLRVRLYHHLLKQWLTSLRQIGFGLVALFPLALPALVLIPLLALGVLANPHTDVPVYLNTLWGYLLLLYSWMNFQRTSIFAARYQMYLDSLPTAPAVKSLCNIGLIVYSANIFVLGPLLLLITILFQQSDRLLSETMTLWHQLVPLTGLLALAFCYTFIAIKKKFPWLSLLAFPLVAFIWAQELTKLQWLLLWSAAIFIEHHIPAISLTLGRWPQGPFQLFLQADIASPEGEKFRLISLLLLITLTRVGMTGLHSDVQPYLLNLVSFLTALVLASSLFGTQSFRSRYKLYLTTLPNKKFPLLIESIFYVFMKTSVGIFLLFLTNFFGSTQWSLWFLFYLGTIAGILWRPQWFLLFPCLIAVGAFLFSMAG